MNSVTSTINRVKRHHFGKSAMGDFPLAVRVDDTLYIGGQHPVSTVDAQSADAPIAVHTHGVFTGMVDTLKSAGLAMADLMKLHTYYVFEGKGPEVTEYWERMTDVRLRYLANPGPAATALRVSGCPTDQQLITVDGIASFDSNRERIMPAHAWDWSIPTPFSQGWRVGNKVYVGGQISADREGKAVAAGDAIEQTKNTLEYIRHVLLDAGSSWKDVVSLKVAYQHNGRDPEAKKLLDMILGVIRETLPMPGPALTCIGVDLLYEGLVLEIDAVAVINADRQDITASGSQSWVSVPGFAAATKVGKEVYVGGTSAPGGASLVVQTEAAMERVGRVLNSASDETADLVKLNVFYTGDSGTQARDSEEIARVIGEYLTEQRPVLSIVRLPGLPHDGQRVQIDAIAVVPSAP